MVLSIPETGLHLESSAKSADTLPLQAFALTLNDNVIEKLIQRVQDGGDLKLSLGNVPVSAAWLCWCDRELGCNERPSIVRHREREPHI